MSTKGWIIVLILSVISSVVITHLYSKRTLEQRLSDRMDVIETHVGTIAEEVNFNTALRSTEAERIALIETVNQLVSEYGGEIDTETIVEIVNVIMEKDALYNGAIKPRAVLSMIAVESSFDPNSVSSVGAKGLMQVMDSTARPILANYGINWSSEILFDPIINLRVGIDYLYNLLEDYRARGLTEEEALNRAMLRYNRSIQAMKALEENPLGLEYTTRIHEVQARLREMGGAI